MNLILLMLFLLCLFSSDTAYSRNSSSELIERLHKGAEDELFFHSHDDPDSTDSTEKSNHLRKQAKSPVSGSISAAVSNPAPYHYSTNSIVIGLNGSVTSCLTGLPVGFDFSYTNASLYGLNSNRFRFFLDTKAIRKKQDEIDSRKFQVLNFEHDSLVRSASAAKGALLFYNQRMVEDSIRLMQDVELRRELTLAAPTLNKDSITVNGIDSLGYGSGKIDSLSRKIEEGLLRLDSLSQLCQKYQLQLDQTSSRLDSVSKVKSGFESAISLQGGLSKRKRGFNWSGFRELEIGRVIPEPTALLVNSPPLFGINTTYEGDNAMAGISCGKQLRVNQYSILERTGKDLFSFPAAEIFFKAHSQSYNDFYLLKGGFGREDGDHVHVYITHVHGKPLYQSGGYNGISRNNEGVELKAGHAIANNAKISYNISSTQLSRSSSLIENKENFSFGRNYALQTEINYEVLSADLELNGNVRYISPEYTSFANPYLIRDQLRYQFMAIKTFSSFLTVSGGIDKENRNISSSFLPQISLLRFRAMVRARIGSIASVSYSFIPTDYQVLHDDEKGVEEKFYNHTMTFSSRFKLFQMSHFITATGSVVVLPEAEDSPVRTVSSYSLSVLQNISRNVSVEYKGVYSAVQDTAKNEIFEPSATSSFTFPFRLRVQLMYALRIEQDNCDHLPGGTVSYPIRKNLELTASCNRVAPYRFAEAIDQENNSSTEYLFKSGLNYCF